ncbi:uncharacterized protein PgNI_08244 [Pyricularia grisea]|uniref:CST complex subunit Stn1 N-terminal domain-containing protein n=1 Tax=Pyricularia grisea TaxID=148305 RepID=A0A6P8AVH3_PYRGI|nr:uncharacterized protein PgNI_08244 [Pyricularia grisea]TLD06202.1 hypothetical protein PgNI_08244 [Pyricularia grisea]
MTSGDPPEIYPQYCFHLSPTIHRWCHLRAADVAKLTTHPGFEACWRDAATTGQDLYFHINHPIKWVRIAGVIVAIDEYNSRRIYTVDDGSGVNMECVTTVAVAKPAAGEAATGTTATASTTTALGYGAFQPRQHTNPRIPNDLDVGQVVEVKGGVSTFRDARQIKVESVAVLRSTRQEVEFWRRTTELRDTVLARPWTLRRRDVRRCRKEAESEDLAGRRGKDGKRRKRAETVEAEEDGPKRRVTGLEPASRPAVAVAVGAAAAGAGGTVSTSRRFTGLEPASRMPAVRASGLEPVSRISVVSAAGDSVAMSNRASESEPASTSRRRTGLEPASRMPVVRNTSDGIATSNIATGLEPASRTLTGTVTSAGARKSKTGLEPMPRTPVGHGTDGRSSSKESKGLEPSSSRTSRATSNGAPPRRITGLEPAARTTTPSNVAPRPKRITGLESRIKHC